MVSMMKFGFDWMMRKWVGEVVDIMEVEMVVKEVVVVVKVVKDCGRREDLNGV